LELKYKAMANVKSELGDITPIRGTFISFQKYLYQEREGENFKKVFGVKCNR